MESITIKYASQIIKTGSECSSTGNLWQGNLKAAKDIEALKTAGITNVLSAVVYQDAEELFQPYKSAGIKQLHIECIDNDGQDLSKEFKNTCLWVEKALKQGNVLIHCFGGVSRSSTFVLAYLIWSQKKSYVESLSQLKAKRPHVKPNENFKKQLMTWEKKVLA